MKFHFLFYFSERFLIILKTAAIAMATQNGQSVLNKNHKNAQTH